MIQERHKQFLLGQVHANNVRHSGRSLYDHLVGTHDLLTSWKNSEDVCNAGLFHSIYGTNKFRHKAWPLEDRKSIIDLIGRDAESLVYVFCTTDRPKAFFTLSEMPPSLIDLSRPLREIEAANLLEQKSGPFYLRKLRDSDISDAAKIDIGLYLEKMVRKAWASQSSP